MASSPPRLSLQAGTYQPPGSIYDLALSQGRVYVAGISRVSALDSRTGRPLAGFNVQVEGTVAAVAVAGSRLVIGGSFTSVNGRPRANLAAVNLNTGVVDPSFRPDPDRSVDALLVRGTRLYLGGTFSRVAGQRHDLLAKVDLKSGQPLATWRADARQEEPASVRGTVYALEARGRVIYAGGTLESVNGAKRLKLAALDAVTGKADRRFSFGQLGAQDTVQSMLLAYGRLYVGGLIRRVNGRPYKRLVALDPTSGRLVSSFRTRNLTAVPAIATRGGMLVVVQDRYLAFVDARSGRTLGFRLTFLPYQPRALLLPGAKRLILGGIFSPVGGEVRGLDFYDVQ